MLACLPLLAAGVAGTISPSGPQVPANLLRIELRFDQPMPALALGSITLRDEAGAPIADALLDIGLPGAQERSLVILMHPGRIKSGVGPNLAIGPALIAGQQVSISVDDPRLAHPLRHRWRVVAARTGAIDPGAWSLRAPAAGGRAPLVLRLPAPLNASAADFIAVADGAGRRLAGKASFLAGETRWHFVPAAPWKADHYQLRIHADLEDPAGNRLCAPFEQRGQSELDCTKGAAIAFRIRARTPT